MYKRKYQRGDPYQSIEEFLADYRNMQGSRYAFWYNKLMHVDFVCAMRLSSIISAIRDGILYKAIKNEEKEINDNNRG